ncbi:MAG: threonine--tRNA ligase [Alphaproteobacteria bacterium]|uniref:Threonine--tRNA ligase n=1 Tax=PS1 clade bacterium TaxID=2175152 RepID=A0A368DMU4_9PROT|nr:MAG: threonine--tRNA ligase [PS1 clade bacterium]|tara:strand:+ start:45233 stop:47155 length:1923 start_codon:yes stop_codon:yes gene_type:complete
MYKYILLDGSQREFNKQITGLELAKSISDSLTKKIIAIKINNELSDLNDLLPNNSKIELITKSHAEALSLIRHDCAHVLAEAVQTIFPNTQVTIGPVIENGFYYDFFREESFKPEDLSVIEKKMHEIISRNERFEKKEVSRDEAIKIFQEKGEEYKVELIKDIPENDSIKIYSQGTWFDLCRGPHMSSTGQIGKAFKLMKIAGAYWRGDSKNVMLQRIYATAWTNMDELNSYINMLEEAEKRDHRKLGREMDLYHFQEEGPGSVFWHKKGWKLFTELIDYMKRKGLKAGYLEVNTPDMLDRSLWEKSGHWEKFGDNMFTSITPDEKIFALKPMNCPGHVQIFKNGLKSYRELPIKYAEFGKVHRYEPSGALHGLMRVRHFTQDDGHIFLTEEQIKDECIKVHELILSIYKDFGFENIVVKFSDRPEKRVGDDNIWDKAEKALMEAVDSTNQKYELNPGEGAFYGPKLEYVLRDAIGRDWQCGTLQVDFNLPGRLGSFYIGSDGEKHVPVMLHRAIFGSLERFTGILIEHYAGKLPLWISPVQVVILTISSQSDEYAQTIHNFCLKHAIRAELDIRNEKISYKIREHISVKIPILFIIGQKEIEDKTVTIREIGNNEQVTLSLEDAVSQIKDRAVPPDFFA